MRTIATAAVVAAALGGPYLASETGVAQSWLGSLSRSLSSLRVNADSTVSDYGQSVSSVNYANHAHHQVEKLRGNNPQVYRYDQQTAVKLGALPSDVSAAPRLTGTTIDDLREVLRFDVSPQWVFSKFSRVTTILADTRLEGLRVPIVTGIHATDIAGTITYFFDQQGNLQRVMLHGFTGDPSKTVATMTEHYGLSRNPSLEAGVFTRAWNGQPVHFLRLSHAPVVYSDAVHQKYTVFLELNQPSLAYGVSEEARRVITSDRGAQRW